MSFFDFLNASVTPHHAAQNLAARFAGAGFAELQETSPRAPGCGKSYFIRRGAALFAFRTPVNFSPDSRFRLASAHTDFPALRITPNPDKTVAGIHLLHPEVYGGALLNTWLDRDLGYAGLLAFERGGKIGTKLFRGGTLCRIPELAVHFNRTVNSDGLKLNAQEHLNACFAAAGAPDFEQILRRELAAGETLLDFDVQFFDAQPAAVGGADGEWIYSGRLDNLSSCDALAEGLLQAGPASTDICGACFFDSEEIGSGTRDGAAGNFLKSSLERIFAGLGGDPLLLPGVLSCSLLISADMAHAEHPSYTEKSEPNHAPLLGKGIVLKTNAQKRYASEAVANARFKQLCAQAKVPFQTFVMRNDMPCGSTVGPLLSASLGIPAVDVGEPMLSMHSVREMTASADHDGMIRLAAEFFES